MADEPRIMLAKLVCRKSLYKLSAAAKSTLKIPFKMSIICSGSCSNFEACLNFEARLSRLNVEKTTALNLTLV
jgi:hypothetical protein